MRLHGSWVFRLSQQHEQVIRGQEEETREYQRLLLQVLVERPLDVVELFVCLLELGVHVFTFSELVDAWVVVDGFGSVAPDLIYILELLRLYWQGLVDIIRGEHRLEVHPSALAPAHLLENFGHSVQLVVPCTRVSLQLASHVR